MPQEVTNVSNAKDVYENTVATLSRSEQLRLAALILRELSESAASDLEYSDTWTEQDAADLTTHALRCAAEAGPGDDDLV
jgi:hypothetical protein